MHVVRLRTFRARPPECYGGIEMANSPDPRRRRGSSGRSARSAAQRQSEQRYGSTNSRDYSRSRQGRTLKGTSHPSQRNQGRYRSERNYRSIAGHDTGYSLKSHRIGFERGSGGLLGRHGLNNRSLLLLLAGLVVILALVAGVSSCVRSCSSPAQPNQGDQTSQAEGGNSLDSRVAAGASDDLTAKFSTALDHGEKIAQIAANANKYPDERLCELALLEPDAIDFVTAVPTAEKSAQAYQDSVTQGTFPELYDWDIRWGFVDYAGSNIGVNGSGPTSLAIAYMGLTGKSDKTPADLAADATSGSYATNEDIATKTDFFASEAQKLGLTLHEYTASGENLSTILADGQEVAVIVQLAANFDSPYVHWAVVVGINQDGSVILRDPSSKQASSHGWAAGTIGSNSSVFYALSYDGGSSATEGNSSGE